MNQREHFIFLPVGLSQVREELATLYQEDAILERLLDRSLIPALIERLAQASAAGVLDAWVSSLSRLDRYLLVHAYPEVPGPLRPDAAYVLNLAYSPPVGRITFRNWRREPGEPAWPELLDRLWAERISDDWGVRIAEIDAQGIRNALQAEDPIQAFTAMTRDHDTVASALAVWTLEGTALGNTILTNHLLAALSEGFRRAFGDDERLRLWILDQVQGSHREAVAVIDRYLTVRPVDGIDPKLIEALDHVWGRSDPPAEPWKVLSEAALARLALWHKDHTLARYLDHERYQFWRRYLDRAERVHTVQFGRDVLIIEFPTCVAVEFMQVGNAARVLSSEDFMTTGWTHRAQSSRLSTADMQHFRQLPYLLRLVHTAGWQFTAERDLRRYLGRPTMGPVGGVD